MKKNKNTELRENDSSLKRIKEGKIKKSKQEFIKKTRDETANLADLNLAPKQGNEFKKNVASDHNTKKNKKKDKRFLKNVVDETKSKNKQKDLPYTINKSEGEAANDITLPKKPKKQKDNYKQKTLETKISSEEKTENVIKKIEKKKAKKLANKLKKQQRKAENKDGSETTAVPKTSKDLSEKKSPITNGEQTPQKLVTAANKSVEITNNKVLSKKEKKAEKRRLIKDKKLAEKQRRDPAIESATVFVGNLPVNTKRVQLIRIFKNFSPVNFIRLRSAGGQLLFKHKQRKLAGALNAYVGLESKEKAENALSLNGMEFKGNHLRVTLSTQKSHSEENGEVKRTVFIGNLKYSATEESLREIFSSCGEIDYVRCIRDGDKGCKGVAYVCFKNADAVGLALELNQTLVNDRPINVERYSIKKLGAKQSRDAQAEKENKSKMGAKQRLEGKKGEKEKLSKNFKNTSNANDVKKSKKSEFRGVKVNDMKKKQKSKKKSSDPMLQLAKKIAPKSQTK